MYTDYLKSDWWKKRKELYYLGHRKICSICGGPGMDLHHKNYNNLYGEKDDDLIVLCRGCHKNIHFGKKSTKKHRRNYRYKIKANHKSWKSLFRAAKNKVAKTALHNTFIRG